MRPRPVRPEEFYDERKLMRDEVPMSKAELAREKWKQEKLSPTERDRMAARKKDLEDKVSSGMPTHTEMWKPTPENVEKHRAWEKAYGSEIRELKQINRRLEPENPHAGRIEYLRKQGEADKLARWA